MYVSCDVAHGLPTHHSTSVDGGVWKKIPASMSAKLRDLIKAVRACKTAAEERAVITKESALVRSAFADSSTPPEYQHRNVSKVLYMHMLGYSVHWAQLECIKLIASSSFAEKRIGYLALSLILDERAEVLTLVTNSIQNDLKHTNQFVVGLVRRDARGSVLLNVRTFPVCAGARRPGEHRLRGDGSRSCE